MLSPAKFNIEIGISLCCAQFLAIIIDSAIKIGLDMDGGCVAHGIVFFMKTASHLQMRGGLRCHFVGLLFPQPSQLLLNDSNLGFGIGFFLAFLVDHGGRSTTHEAFVGKLRFNALQEALGVFQFLF